MPLTKHQERLCYAIGYLWLLWLCIYATGCAAPAKTNLHPEVDFPYDPEEPEPTGPLSLPFPDCEGRYADDIEPWTEHPDTGLCSFACISLGIARDKPIEEICANVGGVCKVNKGNNSGFCVLP